jgi:hypothetical protein
LETLEEFLQLVLHTNEFLRLIVLLFGFMFLAVGLIVLRQSIADVRYYEPLKHIHSRVAGTVITSIASIPTEMIFHSQDYAFSYQYAKNEAKDSLILTVIGGIVFLGALLSYLVIPFGRL